jgi:hypothetical protein
MLTEKTRAYLEGGPESIDAEPKSQKERDYRAEIRNRIKNGIEDLALVAQNIEARDLEQLFNEPEINTNEVAQSDSIAETVLSERGEKYKDYKEMVRVLSMFYEIHWRNGWDFSDTLQMAVEHAHGDPRVDDTNPRDLPHRQVRKEDFEFNPALESVETPQERLERIEEEINDRSTALSPEDQLFYVKRKPWNSLQEQREFLSQQSQRVREQEALERAKDQQWTETE